MAHEPALTCAVCPFTLHTSPGAATPSQDLDPLPDVERQHPRPRWGGIACCMPGAKYNSKTQRKQGAVRAGRASARTEQLHPPPPAVDFRGRTLDRVTGKVKAEQ